MTDRIKEIRRLIVKMTRAGSLPEHFRRHIETEILPRLDDLAGEVKP